jgi:glycosyltransferase involved in cell wall biosynthesis
VDLKTVPAISTPTRRSERSDVVTYQTRGNLRWIRDALHHPREFFEGVWKYPSSPPQGNRISCRNLGSCRMNLLFVTPFFTPQTGGVATYLEDLRRFLAQKGHHVYVLRGGESDTVIQCAMNRDHFVYEFAMRPPWFPETPLKGFLAFLVYFAPTLWRLRAFLREKNINLVSLEYPLPYMFYFRLLRLFTRVCVVTGLHGDDVLSLHLMKNHEQWLVRQIIRKADWVVAHSASLMAHAERVVGKLGVGHCHIPYGVDCERLRDQVGHSGTQFVSLPRPYVLTVAKLYERKGLDVLLKAIRTLGHAAAGYQFVIAGDGPEESHLKSLAHDLGIAGSVMFLGEVQNYDIPPLFQHCEFFVLPSRSEPFGIVLLEAMTFGKAIVATRVGGIPEVIADGVTGLLVPADDTDALANAIMQLIRQPEHRVRLQKNALASVENSYDYRTLIERYESLFHNLIEEATDSSKTDGTMNLI